MYSEGTRILQVTQINSGRNWVEYEGPLCLMRSLGLSYREMKKSWKVLNRGVMWNADRGKRQLHSLVTFPTLFKTFHFEANLDFQKNRSLCRLSGC